MNWIFISVLSAVLFGIQTILRKKILKREHSVEFLTMSFTIGFIFLLPFISKVNFNFSFEVLALIFFRSIFVIVAMISFVKALKHLPISTVAPLSNFKPLFGVALGLILLGEPISLIQFLGILLLLFGAYIIDSEGHFSDWHKPLKNLFTSKNIQFIMVSSLFYAFAALMAKLILKQIAPLDLIFVNFFFKVIILWVITFIFFKGWSDIKEAWVLGKGWLVLASLIGVGAILLSYMALGDPNSKLILILPILQLSTLIDVLLGGKLFKEQHIFLKTIACGLMILGVVLIII